MKHAGRPWGRVRHSSFHSQTNGTLLSQNRRDTLQAEMSQQLSREGKWTRCTTADPTHQSRFVELHFSLGFIAFEKCTATAVLTA